MTNGTPAGSRLRRGSSGFQGISVDVKILAAGGQCSREIAPSAWRAIAWSGATSDFAFSKDSRA